MPPVLNAKAKNISSFKKILPPKKEAKEKSKLFALYRHFHYEDYELRLS